MLRCACTNFGNADPVLDSGNAIAVLASGWSYDTGTTFGGRARSLKVVAPSGSSSVFTLATAPTVGGGQFAFLRLRVTVLPATARVLAGDLAANHLKLNPSGTIAYYNGGSLVGTSTTALTDTAQDYTINWRSGTSSVVILRINGVDEITGNPGAGGNLSQNIGPHDTVAATYTVFFHDLAFDDSEFHGSTNRTELARPVSDNSVGSGWTTSGGSGSNLFVDVDNTPPTGIADTTSNGGHQIRNASSASAAYIANLPTYTALGLGATDTVDSVQAFISTGAPVVTGAKTGSLAIANPTQAGVSFGNFWSGTTAGTYRTGWKFATQVPLTAPSVTIGSAPTLTITITGGTASRIAMCCAVGMWVNYTPVPPPVVISQAVPRATLW